MDIKNLFSINYWLSQPIPAYGATLWILVGGFLFFIIVGLVLRIVVQTNRDKAIKTALKRLSNFGMTMGLLGLMWMFFRQQNVFFLSWRFWLLILIGISAWWLVRILEYVVRRLPVIKQEQAEREMKTKYLPGK